MAKKEYKLVWKCDIPSLFSHIGNHSSAASMLQMPLMIASRILAEVAIRAAELNDPKLNALMCRLALYEVADQHSKNYDEKTVADLLAAQGWH